VIAIDQVIELFETRGAEQYGGEAVSQLQHALQCAELAERAGASPALISAALLHDIGHLLGEGDDGLAERGVDAIHETLGADHLMTDFTDTVSEPARLHVAAKRYLCATDKGYWDRLSPASKRSLELQGGPMSNEEAMAFAAVPFAADAVELRRWDDRGKDPDHQTPPLGYFVKYLERSLKPA
jgi:phosphonate degradation associated HDIG domain protein